MVHSAMIKELDLVALTADLRANDLVAGDIGTVVLVHGESKGYEVEFMTSDGETIGVLSLAANQIRPFPVTKCCTPRTDYSEMMLRYLGWIEAATASSKAWTAPSTPRTSPRTSPDRWKAPRK